MSIAEGGSGDRTGILIWKAIWMPTISPVKANRNQGDNSGLTGNSHKTWYQLYCLSTAYHNPVLFHDKKSA
jgi:hypothetical protein